MYWSLYCGWPVPFISLWHLFLFFEEQSTFMCSSLYCGWPVPLISLWHLFFSSKNSQGLCVDVVLWMTSSSYFLVASCLLFEEQYTFMCWSLYCGWPFPLISLRHPFFSSKNSLHLCVNCCIVDDQFLLFPWGMFSFLRRTVYVYVFIVVLWMTCSSYFLAAFFLLFEEQTTFMCWLLYCGWPVPLISLRRPFFSSKNSQRLCVDRCIVDDQFLLFPCGISSFLRRIVYVYVLIVVLCMTSSSYFLAASFLFFEEQSTFMCWSLHCGWPVPLISLWHLFFSSKNSLCLCVDRCIVDDQFLLFSLGHPFFSSKNSLHLCVDRCIVDDQFLLFPCGIFAFLRRTVYVYVLIVVLWMTISTYFLVASFLFFEEQSTFMCWSLYCGWPVPLISLWNPFFSSKNSVRLCVDRRIVDDQFLSFLCCILSFLRRTVYVYELMLYCGWPVPLISLWHPFFSSKNSLRLCVDRCIVEDQFLLFPCGIFSFLRRTVYVYVLIVVLWMTSSSYFLVASFLFFEEQSTFMCWSLYCGWPVPLISFWHLFFSSRNSLGLCGDVVLWMTSSSYFLVASCLLFEEQYTFMCFSLYCGWPFPLISLRHPFFSSKNSLRLCVDCCIVDDQFLLSPCGIFSFLRRTVHVYVFIVVLWMTSSSYFLVESFLFFEEQSTFMCWSLHCGWPVTLLSVWHLFFSSKNSLRLCVHCCIVDDKFLLFPCGILSFLRRTVYVYVLIVVLWMTSSSYFLWGILSFLRRTVYVHVLNVALWMTSSSYFLVASFLFFEEQSTFMCWSLYCGWPVPLIFFGASFLFFEEQSTFMCWSLHCGWPVPLISLWHLFFSSKNSLRLCVDRCIVDDQFLLFPCGILFFLRRTVYVYVLIVVLWMTSSSHFFAAFFLFFEEQSMFMCWRCIVDDQFLLFPCGILSSLRRTVYVYVLIVVLWMTSSSYFLLASFLFFEEQFTFMCSSLYCGWPVPLISLWHLFFSSKNSLRLCVDRCIVDDQFLLITCGILSFLLRTVYVYVLIVVLWMTSSSYFLVASFLFLEEQSTYMCWSLYCEWRVPLISLWNPFFLLRTVYVYVLIVVLWMTSSSYFLVASFLFFEEQFTFMC